jgi:hypothetical protein
MKRILRPPVLFTNPSLRVIQSAGKLFGVSSNDKEETHVFSQYGQISKREAERMKVSPMREVEHEKKLIPPLSPIALRRHGVSNPLRPQGCGVRKVVGIRACGTRDGNRFYRVLNPFPCLCLDLGTLMAV